MMTDHAASDPLWRMKMRPEKGCSLERRRERVRIGEAAAPIADCEREQCGCAVCTKELADSPPAAPAAREPEGAEGDSQAGALREFWLLQYPFSIFVYRDPEGAKMQQAAYDALVPPVAAGEIIHVREIHRRDAEGLRTRDLEAGDGRAVQSA